MRSNELPANEGATSLMKRSLSRHIAPSCTSPLERCRINSTGSKVRRVHFDSIAVALTVILLAVTTSTVNASTPTRDHAAIRSHTDSTSDVAVDSLGAESEMTAASSPAWYEMITRLPDDWKRFATESFQMKNVPLAIGISGLTAGLMAIDNPLWQTEDRWYRTDSKFRAFSNDMVFVGDGRFQFGIVGAFAAYGFAFSDSRSLRTASEVTEAILATGAVVQFLKHATGRERPEVSTEVGGNWTFFPGQLAYLKHVPHYDSFPSGHIATATTTLIVIAENYPELTWLKPVGYVVLGMISSSLVAYGIHWWSDIPLGVVLGYTFGEIVSYPLGISLAPRDVRGSAISVQPVLLQSGIGVGVGLTF